MAGPWEQYQQTEDPSTAGPWAQYQEPEADFGAVTAGVRMTPQPEPSINPTEGMGTGERIAAGFGRSFAELGRGLKQAGTNAAIGLSSAFAGDPQFRQALRQQTDPIQQRQQSEIDDARALDAPLMATGGGQTGNALGVLSQIIGPGLLARGSSAAAAFLPSTIRGNAAQGAALGALQPTSTGESRGLNSLVGGAAGGAGAAVFKGAGAGINALRNIGRQGVDGTDRAAAAMLAGQAADPASITRAAPSAVPGVQRTLAEETLDPGIARLERNMRSTSNQFDAIDRSNNAARVNQLDRIAGTDADMAAAEAARDQATAALRNQAFTEGDVFDASARAARAASEAQNRQVVERAAAENARRRSLGLPDGPTPPAASATPSPKDQLVGQVGQVIERSNGNPAVQSTLASVGGALRQAEDSVGGLYNVRKYIADLLSGRVGGDTTSARAASRELMEIRSALDEELTRRAPSFSGYLTAYQDASRPINRMEVGRELAGAGSGGAVLDPITGAQWLTPAQFSKRARDLDAVAAKATGFGKARADQILQAGDIAVIKAIQDDLERQAFRATAGSGGNSQTFERAALDNQLTRRVGSDLAGQIPMVGPYIRDFVGVLDKSRNDRVKERLAYLVANPEQARRVIAALPPAGQTIVTKALTQLGGTSSTAAGVTGLGAGGLEIDVVGGTPVPAAEFDQGPYQ